MQNDAVDVVWRPRSTWEGCDLGIRLLQSWLRPAFTCYLAVAVPLFCLFAATGAVAAWLPFLLIWISKPWLDRTVLFVLSRALFGRPTSPLDVWRARADVWWHQLLATLTLRRLTASRSFTQPIVQLEGLRGAELRARMSQLAARHRGVARAATQAFGGGRIRIVRQPVFLAGLACAAHGCATLGAICARLRAPRTRGSAPLNTRRSSAFSSPSTSLPALGCT